MNINSIMKNLLFILPLLLFSQISLGQYTLQGKVLNATTNEPIPFVNIGVKETAKGTVSNYQGDYELVLDNTDSKVIFSSIGFEVVSLSVKELLETTEVRLIPKSYELPEVVVTVRNLDGDYEMYGVKNKNRGLSVAFGSAQLGTEIGALIKIKKPIIVSTANFVLNHAKGDSLLFRLNIYDYTNKEVGEKILKEDIIIREKQRKGLYTIDLTSYNLILRNDILLSLEWIQDDNGQGNEGITFDTKGSGKLSGVMLKHSSIGDFKKMKYIGQRLKPCFYFIAKKWID